MSPDTRKLWQSAKPSEDLKRQLAGKSDAELSKLILDKEKVVDALCFDPASIKDVRYAVADLLERVARLEEKVGA